MRMNCIRPAAALACLALAAVGCSSGGGNLKGQVKLDGQGVEKAQVTFHPAADATGIGLYSVTTDAQGNFELAPPAGIAAGDYKVTVVKYATGMAEAPGMDIEQLKMMGKAKNVLPRAYEMPARTPLTVTLKKGANEVPVELKSG